MAVGTVNEKDNPYYGKYTGDFPFASFLEEVPKATYFSYGGQFGQAPKQRRHYENAFQSVYDQFMGVLGQQARRGQEPGVQYGFADFMADYPFTQRYTQLPPSFRGDYMSRFAPRTRFLTW